MCIFESKNKTFEIERINYVFFILNISFSPSNAED